MVREAPRSRILAAAAREGAEPFVRRCVGLLDRREFDASLIGILGGDGAAYVLGGGEGGPEGYWPRVWALRALTYVWHDSAAPAAVRACDDGSWRVREMALRVLAAQRLPAGATAARRLTGDDVARVRARAEQVVHRLGAGH